MSEMTKREWLRATWAEWAPSLNGGRFEVGRLVIMTRSEMHESAWRHMELAVKLEQKSPGIVAEVQREKQREKQAATVRHLHAV